MSLWNKKQQPLSQKVEKQAPRLDMAEIGFTGLNIFSGQIFERFRRKLRNWDEAAKVYIEMRDVSPTIGAMLFAISMLIRQADWPVVPASNENEDAKAAEFLEENMQDMSNTWKDTIDENLSMFPFGFSFHEIVYKRRLGPDQKDPSRRSRFNDGAIAWRKMPIRAQETIQRWNMDEHGGLQSVEQSAPPLFRTVTIPVEKGLLFRASMHKGNPEGRSILLNAVRPWFFLKRIEEIEAVFDSLVEAIDNLKEKGHKGCDTKQSNK
ncbi:hypothetical protein LCGC14_2680670 [marine sediment metagenome]|uniref:Uncharacterized protein n=1 Tax=marine sediment metagenome TaxID=412755 RepID=A0A0F8ZLG6_9ZZZZ